MNIKSIGQNTQQMTNMKTVVPKKASEVINKDGFTKSTGNDPGLIPGKNNFGSEPASTSVMKAFVKAAVILAGITAVGVTGGAFAGAALIGGTAGAVIGGVLGGGAGVGLAAAGAKLAEKM